MDIQEELERAEELEHAERIEEAIGVYTKILERFPDCAKAWQERGTLYFTRQNRFNDAMSDLEQFIRLRPNDPSAYSDRACLYRYVYFESAKEDYLLELAIEDFTRAIELGETDEEWREDNLDDTYFTRGTCYLDLKDYARAVADFKRYGEEDTPYTVFECLAQAYVGLRQYTNALQAANRSIALGNEYPEVFALRSEIHGHLGDMRAAEKDRRRAEKLGKSR
jgi:tetratricopeptide (TPR) repeat protein